MTCVVVLVIVVPAANVGVTDVVVVPGAPIPFIPLLIVIDADADVVDALTTR